MGRPPKENLPYFSHDTDMRRDKKMAISIATSSDSMKLFGTYVALLEDIYHNKYYMEFSEEDAILFCQPFSDLNIDTFWDIIETLLERGLFDKELYDNYGILTSRSIQERWLKACERRKEVTMHKAHVLLDVSNFVENYLGKNYAGEKLQVNIVSDDNKEIIGGKIEDDDSNKEVIDNNKDSSEEKEEEPEEEVEKYDLQKKEKWKEGTPIDFNSVVDFWNKVNDASARMTPPKKTDIKRALRVYSGIQIARALYVRSKDEHIGKYRTQWSTFFGQKTLQNMDKWVDKAQNAGKKKEKKLTSVSDFVEIGWFRPDKAKEIASQAGMPLEDAIYWESKKVEDELIYHPKFDV